ATNGEIAKLVSGVGIGDVVIVGVGVSFYPQLVGPEIVDDVQRCHVEGDLGVGRDDQLVRLEAAEGRVPVGEQPLLGYYLDRQDLVRRRREQRVGALAPACPGRRGELV